MTTASYRAIDQLSRHSAGVPAILAAANELTALAAEVEELRDENDSLRCRNDELTALAKTQADEIRSTQLRLDQLLGKRAGW